MPPVCRLLKKFEDAARDGTVSNVETVRLRGHDAKYEIEEWANTIEVDNLVLARRGDSERPEENVGSTTDYCLAKVKSNVLVIK